MWDAKMEEQIKARRASMVQYRMRGLQDDIVRLERHGLRVKKEEKPWYLVDPRPGRKAAHILGIWDAFTVFALVFIRGLLTGRLSSHDFESQWIPIDDLESKSPGTYLSAIKGDGLALLHQACRA